MLPFSNLVLSRLVHSHLSQHVKWTRGIISNKIEKSMDKRNKKCGKSFTDDNGLSLLAGILIQ